MIFFISPYFLMIFQVGGGRGAEPTAMQFWKNLSKIGGEGIQKELSDNDVVDIYTFLPRHDFPCTFLSDYIFLVQSIKIELYVSHKNCIFITFF